MKPVLTFDLWMTLIRSNPDFKPARNEMLRKALAPGHSLEQFTDALVKADKQFDSLSEDTGMDFGFVPRVTTAVADLTGDVYDVRVLERLKRDQDDLAKTIPPVPMHKDIPALIASLKDKYTIAVISNTGMLDGSLMRELLLSNDMLKFDHYTFSNETVFSKPDPMIFRYTLKSLGVEAKNATHIGDNENADIRGAKAVGMDAILVGKNGRPINEVLEGLL